MNSLLRLTATAFILIAGGCARNVAVATNEPAAVHDAASVMDLERAYWAAELRHDSAASAACSTVNLPSSRGAHE